MRALLVAIGLALSSQAARQPDLAFYEKLPLSFEANRGQAAGPVRFLARGRGYVLWLTPSEIALATGRAAVRMKFVGANRDPYVEGVETLPGRSHYFLGNDPAQWRTGIPNYRRVRYRALYAGVDLELYGEQRQLEYDLVAAPGADPAAIRLAFEGARRLRIAGNGDLIVETGGGKIRQRRPVVYQSIDGVRRAVAARYVLRGRRQAGFELGAYDRSQPLVIDPALQFSTYLGGVGDDTGAGIAVDAAGSVYVVGATTSVNFPVSGGAVQSAPAGGRDVFVTKLNPVGPAISYSTYLGGGSDDTAAGIAVDSAGNAYVAGTTSSANFPVSASAFRGTFGGSSDAFVVKLDAAGSALVYSTYLGGSNVDQGNGIAVDAAGNAYVTGTTFSSDFPATAGAIRNFLSGTNDAFVTKLDASGSGLAYSTFLGGSGSEQGYGIAVDGSGNAYVTGSTTSINFPTANPLQASCASSGSPFGAPCVDTFVAKLNAAGSAFVYSTYLGGKGSETGRAIAVDGAGNAYVAGVTNSIDFPTTAGALQRTLGGGPEDAFVVKLSAAGSALAYSTYLGGDGDDMAFGIAVDAAGLASLAGSTTSTNFPVAGALQAACATGGVSTCADGFITKLNAAGSGLVYSSYFGGSGIDRALAIAVDASRAVYVTGDTLSANLPTTGGAIQTSLGGATDAFIARIILENNPAPTLGLLSPSGAAAGGPDFTLTLVGSNFVTGAVARWNGGDRPTTFVSSSQLSAVIPAADIATGGTAQVTVFNPPPGGGVSNALPFVIVGPAAPELGAIFPGGATAGGPGFTLSVTGRGFVSASVVRWNGSDRPTTFFSSTQLQASIPASDIAVAGVAQITVFTPGSGVSNSAPFSITNPLPVIATLAPSSAPAGGADFFLTVNGSNFVPGALVLWNGNARSTTLLSSTQLRAAIPASDIAAAGAAQVTVFNPGPGGGSSAVFVFNITAAPIVGAGGVVNAASFGNQPVAVGAIAAVFGSNLAATTAQASVAPLATTLGGVTVRLNGVPAPLFFVSPLQINFLVPWELQGQSPASLVVESGGALSNPQRVSLAAFGPALFATNRQGTGQGAILIAGSASLAAPAGAFPGSRPVSRGEYLEIYGVGLGPVSPQPPSGFPAGASSLSGTTATPAVAIGGVPATVTFSGLTAGFVGLYQVNVQVPESAPSGSSVAVVLTIGGLISNTVTIAVQ